MRTLFSALFAIVAIVLTPVAVSAAWMDQQVVSEQGFVELAGPLGGDEEFQSSLADALGEHLSTQTGLPAELNALVKPVIAETVQSVATLPGYEDAWNESLHRSHELIFTGQQTGGEGLSLEIAPIVALAVSSFSESTGFNVEAPGSVPVEVGSGNERQLVNQMQRVASVWLPIAVVAGVAAVIALLVAKVRSTTLALMGLGVALSGALLWYLTENYRDVVPQQGGGSEVGRLFRDSLLARGADEFSLWTVYLMGAGAVVFVLGSVIRSMVGRRFDRRRTDRA